MHERPAVKSLNLFCFEILAPQNCDKLQWYFYDPVSRTAREKWSTFLENFLKATVLQLTLHPPITDLSSVAIPFKILNLSFTGSDTDIMF